MGRKGFPESYDVRRLVQFMAEVKSGKEDAEAPVYSHMVYDIVPGETQVVRQPDILIVEGLNVLQSGMTRSDRATRRRCSSPTSSTSPSTSMRTRPTSSSGSSSASKRSTTIFRDPDSYFHRSRR